MAQTPTTFKNFLKRCENEWKTKYHSAKKPTKIYDCINGCDVKIILKKEKFTHAVPPYIFKGIFWVYECPKCKGRFTSSESDTISMATLKPSKK